MPGDMASRIQQANFDRRIDEPTRACSGERDLDPAAVFLKQRQRKPECGRLPGNPPTEFAVAGPRGGPIKRSPDIVDQMPVFAKPRSTLLGAPISFGLPQGIAYIGR